MKNLGIVKNVAYNGKLVVKAGLKPKIGEKVYDRSMSEVGKVWRVFGPVKAPYVSVKPKSKEAGTLLGLIGKEVYIQEKGGI